MGMTRLESHGKIKKFWTSGTVFFTPHWFETQDDRGIDAHDVRSIIFRGRVVEVKASDYPDLPIRCIIEGPTVDGRRFRLVADMNGMLEIVSTHRLRR